MRPLLSAVLALVLACQPLLAWAQAPPPPGVVRLSQGTVVAIRPPYDVRSDKVKTGDVLEFRVVQPIRVNGVTLVDAGAPARVTISEARHAAGFGQQGRLKLAVDTVTAVDGTRIRLRGAPDHKGGDNTALSVAGIVVFSVFFVFLQGKEAVLKADKELLAYIDEDRDFTVGGAAPQVSAPPTAPAVMAVPVAPGPPEVQRTVLCEKIDDKGRPVKETPGLHAKAKRFTTWFAVLPANQDRIYDLRWYCADRLVTSGSATVRAGLAAGWVEIKRASDELAPGDWRIDIFRDGRLVGTHGFAVTR